MKVALYARVSTLEQAENNTIAIQTEFARRYAELHELSVVDAYEDDGISGTVPLSKRAEGARLLADAREKRFDVVLIYRVDRLGRSARVILDAVEELEALGVQIRSMTEPFDTTTPSGRFLLNVLGAVAGYEKDTILERTLEGTKRRAREGAWLGGIVPYGYRVEGVKRSARLVISEQPIPAVGMSEAEVVMLMFRKAADEGWTCPQIADHLNALGVPPSYARAGREVGPGKRKAATAGVWWSSRILNILKNATYKGVHEWGKRATRIKEPITREVPAIVDADTWDRAQENVRKNFLFGRNSRRRKYLLRGLIKCGVCGLTYCGTSYPDKAGAKTYYVCNGKTALRGPLGRQGKRCPSKAIPGQIEAAIWSDIEGFLRNPGEVLDKLAGQRERQSDSAQRVQSEVQQIQRALAVKQAERERIITAFRRGRITDAELGQELGSVREEEAELERQVATLQGRLRAAEDAGAQLSATEDLLRSLRTRLDRPLSWDLRRQLVEKLVDSIRVDVVEENGRKVSNVVVTYSFAPFPPLPASHETGRGSSRRRA